MNALRNIFHRLLLFAGLGCAALQAAQPLPPPRYYPASDTPIAGEPSLGLVESALPVGAPQPTCRFPIPDASFRLATTAEFLAAFKVALTNNPADAAGIITAAARVGRVSEGGRKDKAIPLIREELIAAAGEVPAVIAHLEEILVSLIDDDPRDAVAITAAVLRIGALGGATADQLRALAQAGTPTLLTGFKPAEAPFTKLAKAALGGAITTELTSGTNAELAAGIIVGLIRGVRDSGIETIVLDDLMRGASAALSTTPDVTVSQLATAAFAEATPSRHHAILIAAGLAIGLPFDQATPELVQQIIDAGNVAWPGFSAEIAAAATHAFNIRFTAENLAGLATRQFIADQGPALSDAIVCAALMARDKESGDILRAGFDTTFGSSVPPLAVTIPGWLRIALSGRPAFVPEALERAFAVGNTEGLFTGSVTPGAVATALLAARAPLPPNAFFDAAATLIESGGASTLIDEVGLLTAEVANGPDPFAAGAVIAPLFEVESGQHAGILTKAILGTDDSEVRAAIAAAAIAADPSHGADHLATALAADPDTGDDAAIGAAGAAASGLTTSIDGPGWKVAAAMRTLISAHPGQTLAVVLGARTIAPKQTLAILAAALGSDLTFDLSTARTLAPEYAPALAVAAELGAAEAADAAAPGTTLALLFDTVENAVLAHRFDVESITAAAAIAAPRYAHHSLHAAAFRYPGVALKSVQAAFANAPVASAGDQAARAAALTAGCVNGIREARFVGKETEQLRLAIGAAVKAARELTGPPVVTSNGTRNGSRPRAENGPAAVVTGLVSQLVQPGDTTLRSRVLLTAAVLKAKNQALAMAQAAAQTAVRVAGTNAEPFKLESIVDAVAAAQPGYTRAQLRHAAKFGRTQALQNIPGAGAAGISNYEHHSGTTDPRPSLEGL